MQAFHLKNAPEVEVSVRKSGRARRMSLRVSSLDGRVTLTLPPGTPARVARAFAEEKARWIANAVGQVAKPIDVTVGSELPIEGAMRRVVIGRGRSARLVDDARIEVPEGKAGPAIEAFLKHLARDRLATHVTAFCNEIGQPSGRLTLRDTRSRWGSCTSEGNLMFSWRLAMAPPEVLTYVAAHEVAHLQHMDHSRDFWDLCGVLFADVKVNRLWLRQNGADLHRYRFRGTD